MSKQTLKVRTGTALFLLAFLAAPLFAQLPAQISNFASPAYWGMAHSGGAVAEVSTAYWLNPALSPYDRPYSLSLNEAFLPGTGITLTGLSGHYRIRGGHVLTTGLNFENYGSFEARDGDGIPEGEFTASQYQFFLGYAYRISERFAAGLQLVLQGDRIDESRENYTYLRYGFSYTFGARANMLAFSGVTNGLDSRWRASFSHRLEYLPLRLNIDFRWYGDDLDPASFTDEETGAFVFQSAALYFAEKLTLGAYIEAGERLYLMAGIDLARLNLRSNTFGLDTLLSGVALGGSYRFDSLELSLALYHYANFTTMTALGISYSGK
ncbi:MAG: hypothetical protein JXR21_00945 [Candidatus Marinimicrobia bacterium]|nr:hypothetical protein [Candidatus Neomarinimicrobiota bacterium]